MFLSVLFTLCSYNRTRYLHFPRVVLQMFPRFAWRLHCIFYVFSILHLYSSTCSGLQGSAGDWGHTQEREKKNKNTPHELTPLGLFRISNQANIYMPSQCGRKQHRSEKPTRAWSKQCKQRVLKFIKVLTFNLAFKNYLSA